MEIRFITTLINCYYLQESELSDNHVSMVPPGLKVSSTVCKRGCINATVISGILAFMLAYSVRQSDRAVYTDFICSSRRQSTFAASGNWKIIRSIVVDTIIDVH